MHNFLVASQSIVTDSVTTTYAFKRYIKLKISFFPNWFSVVFFTLHYQENNLHLLEKKFLFLST